MRSAAIIFVLEHWRFFLGFIAFGITSALILSGIKKLNAARRAREDEAQSRALDAELAKIRADQAQNR
jgi:hypothetical protein